MLFQDMDSGLGPDLVPATYLEFWRTPEHQLSVINSGGDHLARHRVFVAEAARRNTS